jgi:hypothetical protein
MTAVRSASFSHPLWNLSFPPVVLGYVAWARPVPKNYDEYDTAVRSVVEASGLIHQEQWLFRLLDVIRGAIEEDCEFKSGKIVTVLLSWDVHAIDTTVGVLLHHQFQQSQSTTQLLGIGRL